MNNALTISELNTKIKNLVERSNQLTDIVIIGEIADLKLHNTGHIYFSLKDEYSSIKATIWKSKAYKLKQLNPFDGMKIKVVGSVNHYVPYGQISLNITDVFLDGEGELKKIYQERFNHYSEKHYFDDNRKKKINFFPERIAIITAIEGDAIHDIVKNIRKKNKFTELYIFPALVQGVESAENIAQQIKHVNNFKLKIDTIILGRGGGSYEHLAAFNEPVVVEAIYNSKIPVITGIGHDKDQTLAEFVSDLRASTPTGAGIESVADVSELINSLDSVYNVMQSSLLHIVEKIKLKINNYLENYFSNLKNKIIWTKEILKNKQNILNNSLQEKIYNFKIHLNNLEEGNINIIKNIFKDFKNKIYYLEQILEANDINNAFKKGFSILKKEGKVVTSVKKLNIGDTVTALLSDGDISLKV